MTNLSDKQASTKKMVQKGSVWAPITPPVTVPDYYSIDLFTNVSQI